MARRASKAKQATTNISMPASLRARVDQRVSGCGFGNVSEYFRHLVREDLRTVEFERRRITQLIREGLESGPGVEVTDEWWERKLGELVDRHKKRRKAG
jgi:antitoxin ParD1/3/4